MSEARAALSAYDEIAHFYDVDMGRNMPFDDVGLYTALAAEAAGPILEVGCGNGRILLELVRRRFDAYGIDRSAAMLAALVRRANGAKLGARVFRMDARAMAFSNAFALVLCPYSLVTYMASEQDLARLMNGVRRALCTRGRVVIDAFIPQAHMSGEGFRLDYRRAHGDGMLTRSKRVSPLAAHLNRIERRYELVSRDGRLLQRIETSEDIRPFTPEALCELLIASGFSIDGVWWDYASDERSPRSRFFTVSAGLATPSPDVPSASRRTGGEAT